ncbi:MAG: hypothetical protein SGI92_17970 [Bryobacteraceae bacterium]|nr:hypothetical protein [Bryobacteraceae bacterium]
MLRLLPPVLFAAVSLTTLHAQTSGPGCAINPASPSVGAGVPAPYFAPPLSTVDPRLAGPLQLITAGVLDAPAGTITMPLYKGRMRDGRAVWYILTDTTDEGNARALGINFSPRLNFAAVGRGVRLGTLEKGGVLVFESGTVDFTPVRRVVAGPASALFPPTVTEPGSRGDNSYTPLVRIANAGGHGYNAPMIAFDALNTRLNMVNGSTDYSVVHDKVVRIDPRAGTDTLALTPGFSFARPVLYLSTDASAGLAAAMEGAKLAPGLVDIAVGADDSAFSAVERIFAFINGPRSCNNPQRQGFDSALLDGCAPMNVLGGIPTIANDYSPLWDLNRGAWTESALMNQYRTGRGEVWLHRNHHQLPHRVPVPLNDPRPTDSAYSGRDSGGRFRTGGRRRRPPPPHRSRMAPDDGAGVTEGGKCRSHMERCRGACAERS